MYPAEVDSSKSDASSARSSSAHLASGQPTEFLSFRLGSEEYGIDILNVQEIRGYEEPTRMVNVPSYVKEAQRERMLILMDIAQLMDSADMKLIAQAERP